MTPSDILRVSYCTVWTCLSIFATAVGLLGTADSQHVCSVFSLECSDSILTDTKEQPVVILFHTTYHSAYQNTKILPLAVHCDALNARNANMTKEIESTSRCNVPPSMTISWVISTGFCFWFLWIHAPVVLSAKDYIEPLLYFHLVGAYSIYMACAHNTLLTPSSLGGAARPFHVWIGRIGLLLGVMGFLTGAILTWFIMDYTQSWGFSIGITYGGLEQMRAQITG